MQQDTRNLTVALEHLRATHEEITLAQGQTETSIVQAALERAMDHLDLIARRLERERAIADRGPIGTLTERAFAGVQRARQGLFDLLNAWPQSVSQTLDPVRMELLEAISAAQEAFSEASGRQKVHG